MVYLLTYFQFIFIQSLNSLILLFFFFVLFQRLPVAQKSQIVSSTTLQESQAAYNHLRKLYSSLEIEAKKMDKASVRFV